MIHVLITQVGRLYNTRLAPIPTAHADIHVYTSVYHYIKHSVHCTSGKYPAWKYCHDHAPCHDVIALRCDNHECHTLRKTTHRRITQNNNVIVYEHQYCALAYQLCT